MKCLNSANPQGNANQEKAKEEAPKKKTTKSKAKSGDTDPKGR